MWIQFHIAEKIWEIFRDFCSPMVFLNNQLSSNLYRVFQTCSLRFRFNFVPFQSFCESLTCPICKLKTKKALFWFSRFGVIVVHIQFFMLKLVLPFCLFSIFFNTFLFILFEKYCFECLKIMGSGQSWFRPTKT